MVPLVTFLVVAFTRFLRFSREHSGSAVGFCREYTFAASRKSVFPRFSREEKKWIGPCVTNSAFGENLSISGRVTKSIGGDIYLYITFFYNIIVYKEEEGHGILYLLIWGNLYTSRRR